MGSVPIEKIETMLKVYRDRLEKVDTPPIDYVEGIRVLAKIGVLEDLYYYALHVAAQQSVEREGDENHIETVTPPGA